MLIIATGDTSQLEPVSQYSKNKNYDLHVDEYIDSIPPHEIYLKIKD